ncbi:signal recognition particle-docking protein FtsY [Baumannia cicadellinicola str. Hc (Homalodisca coagulata)]|uniref:Signal recognition particle receptor FtsY n=1 Tax=Baumannia cicadellinicola subsp. Homalodisca coagulata TaxID=374463 RepID=Q1LU30_BAUCH|nr:signal recognition particle-docking protein FtsY [Baumannia cicadellinicola str. Hc (Homalodisca coagulata)]MBS0032594.1 signal recognition particle-docking protein FtsY [Candidatus Baumannia cicadellinicola]
MGSDGNDHKSNINLDKSDGINNQLTSIETNYATPNTVSINQQYHNQNNKVRDGWLSKLKRSLVNTSHHFSSGLMRLFSSTKIDNHLFDQIETQLLMADVGFETTKKILDSLITYVDHNKIKNTDALYSKLRADMTAILSLVNKPLVIENKKPFIILMVGVNGAGKTTTIGKIAHQYQVEKKSVMLAAGDTFRAAAVEQLQAWGELNNIPVVAQHTGADSASVIFDSIQSAKARGIDVLIADTSGRLQNNVSLMEELKKIVRVMKKIDIEAPHEVMLTIDAGTGQNAVQQALLFNKTIKITGITLTKLDGTAKGGVIFAIADQFKIPIRYISIGERISDLRAFNSNIFVEAIFSL